MELETLKNIWQQQTADQPVISRKEIDQISSLGSKSPVAMIKRNLRMEMFAVLSLYSIAILYFLIGTTYIWIAVVLSLLLFLYLIYYSRKKNVLDQMTDYDNPIRVTLEIQIKLLMNYIKWYGLITAILSPLIFILVLTAWYIENPYSWYLPGNLRFYLLFGCMGIAFSVLSFIVNKWYVHHLYG